MSSLQKHGACTETFLVAKEKDTKEAYNFQGTYKNGLRDGNGTIKIFDKEISMEKVINVNFADGKLLNNAKDCIPNLSSEDRTVEHDFWFSFLD